MSAALSHITHENNKVNCLDLDKRKHVFVVGTEKQHKKAKSEMNVCVYDMPSKMDDDPKKKDIVCMQILKDVGQKYQS